MSLPDNYDNWRLDNNEPKDEQCSECKGTFPANEIDSYCYLDDDGHELYVDDICYDCHESYQDNFPGGIQNEYIKSCNDMLKG